MKYYSEITKQMYDRVEDLNEAEGVAKAKIAIKKKKDEEKDKRAKEVSEAFAKAYDLYNKYNKDYGCKTFSTKIDPLSIFFDIF
jgi:hypothetical protein